MENVIAKINNYAVLPNLINGSANVKTYVIGFDIPKLINTNLDKGILTIKDINGNECTVTMKDSEIGYSQLEDNKIEFNFKTQVINSIITVCNNQEALKNFDWNTMTREYSDLDNSIKPQAYTYKTTELSKNSIEITPTIKDAYKSSLSLGDYYVIDPTYSITNTSTNAGLTNVTCEDGYFCHSSLFQNNSQGIIFYMPFDDNSSNTTVYDYSRNNYDAVYRRPQTHENTTWISNGKFGGAMQFWNTNGTYHSQAGLNGKNASLNPSTNFTVSFWFKTNFSNIGSERQIVFLTGNWYFGLDPASSRLRFLTRMANGTTYSSTVFVDMTFNAGLANGKNWTNAVCSWGGTRAGGNASCYINGAFIGGANPETGNTIGSNAVVNYSIGYDTNNLEWNGTIDEITVWNRSMTATEVSRLYSNNPKAQKFSQYGTQNLNYTLEAGYNTINISIGTWSNGNNQTNLSLTIFNGTGWTDYLNITQGIVKTYNMTENYSFLNMTFLYNLDNHSYFSPVLRNITLTTYYVAAGGGDTTKPLYSGTGANNSNPSILDNVLFYSYWNDNALGSYIFSWNASGLGCDTWANDSYVVFTSGSANITKQIPATCLGNIGGIGWRIWANDTSGNYNTTNDITSFTQQNTCTYSGTGKWSVTCSDNCVISSPVVGDGSNFSAIGSGKFTINANISGFKNYYLGQGCNALCSGGCFKT